MVKKIIGYILAGIGIIGFASTIIPQIPLVPFIEGFYGIAAGELNPSFVNIPSIAIIIIGVILVLASGKAKQKSKEVPIYKGKDIIGYRQD